MAYKFGITNNVKSVEKNNPKIIIYANGTQIGDFPPKPIAIGISPEIVVTLVSIIGRKRKPLPVIIASTTFSLPDLLLLIKSINTIASLTTIPDKATIPNIAMILSAAPVHSNPTMAPITPNGTANMIIIGWRKDLN